MPPAVAAVAAGALSGGFAAAAGTVVFGLSTTLSAVLIGVATAALSFVSSALSPKPSLPSLPDFSRSAQDRTLALRAPAGEWWICYGIVRIAGCQSFVETRGSSKEMLHMVETHAGHRFRAILAVLLDNEFVPLDAAGEATGKYAGFLKAEFGLGTTSGDADLRAALEAAVPEKWTTDHRQTGRAKTYFRLKYDRDKFPGSFPNLSVIAETYDTIFDPRTGLTGFTDNWALCLAHYLRLPELECGIGAQADEIDEDDLIVAANICDEMAARLNNRSFTADAATDEVTLPASLGLATGLAVMLSSSGALPGGLSAAAVYYWIASDPDDPLTGQLAASPEDAEEGTAVAISSAGTGTHTMRRVVTLTADPDTDIVTLADRSAALRLGTRLTVANVGGALPGGLTAATEYFWIYVTTDSGKLATSLVNARAGTAVAISSAGTGTQTLTVDAEPRYTMTGSFRASEKPQDILRKMLSAGAGSLVYAGGKWHIYAGAWRPATVALGKENLDGGISVMTRRSRRDLCNGVKGVFSNPDNLFQPGDYPAVQVAAYLDEDNGEEIWRDQPLDFTNSPSMAQRIARIMLERIRRQITTKWPCDLSGLRVQAMTTVALTNDLWGWAGKTFECTNFTFAIRGGGAAEDSPRFGTELDLTEIDAAVFAWDPSVDEQAMRPAPTTSLPDPFTVAPPTGLTCESGTDQLYERADGTQFSRIRVSWTPPADIFVTSDGAIEIRYRRVALPGGAPVDEPFQYLSQLSGVVIETWILDVQDRARYDVEARALNGLGVGSDPRSAAEWTARVAAHLVIGKTAPPSDVTGFSAAQNGTRVNFRANGLADADLDRIEIRRRPLGSTDWDAGDPTANILRGQTIVTESVPPGAWSFLAGAFDRSGNRSENVARFDLTVINVNSVLFDTEQAPRWLGTRTGFIRHPTGVLVPDDENLADDYGFEVFDEFVPTPVAVSRYEAPEIDLTQAGGVRAYALMEAFLGPGETSGAPAPALEIDYRVPADAYDGFEPWSSGSITARYVKARAVIVPALGVAALSAFKPVVDVESREELHPNFAVGSGGSPLTFDLPFFAAPLVQVTPIGATAQIGQPDNVTGAGADIHLFNTTGAGVSGTANVTVSGA